MQKIEHNQIRGKKREQKQTIKSHSFFLFFFFFGGRGGAQKKNLKRGNGNFCNLRKKGTESSKNKELSNWAFRGIDAYIFEDIMPNPKRITLISSRIVAVDEMKVLPERKNQWNNRKRARKYVNVFFSSLHSKMSATAVT